ncbi:pneumococcal-type histidine triad protein [Streptococcus catagoni]|uniref:pneumococcal-type histidine triad protein n=1 Tax=Streptococcus catagoni TaxID=2654874 RepID=UPI001A9F44CB|nr:pneumococcal-type histidine triad protein [Streptococcus catagoni]
MKQHKRLLYLAGTLLICSLTLAAYQSSTQKQSQEPKKHQKVSKASKVSKAKHQKADSKEIAGIDKPTNDGFLLTDESQIEDKTDAGIIVKHGDHKHFFFYADLKGTKWAYLIPKSYHEGVNPTQSQSTHTNSPSGQTEDGYVFNPRDIVAEDLNGYTVRHGDHYHYILKSSLAHSTVRQLTSSNVTRPTIAPIIHRRGGNPGIDFQTSDGFLFDGTNISGTTDTGILVKHGKHLHPISFEDLKNSKWHYLIKQYKPNAKPKSQLPAKPTAKPSITEDTEYQSKLAYLAKGLNVDPSRIKKIIVDGQVGLEYPHEDHTHVILLKEIDLTKPFEKPEDRILKQRDDENFEQRKERLIKEFMNRYKVKREDITIDGNYMSIRHGDHAHVYKIDPNLPDDPERNVKTESTNLEVEKQLVYGPFFTEGARENLTRNGVYQKYNPSGIQNIKNFILLTFSTNSEYGDLEIDGKKTKRVYYLVRKDLNWEDLQIQRPDAVKKEGRIFKGWSAELPTSGKMSREHKGFYADFNRIKNQPTKNIYTPSDDITDIDLSNYVSVKYTTISNGRLQLNNLVQGGFTYFVKSGLTWKEAKEQGLVEPTPVPNDNYEFIEFRGVSIGGVNENDPVSTTINLAAFGTTAPHIGPYTAANPDNPTDINDPSRHPNYYWHNPKNYVAVAFRAEEGGRLQTRLGTSKTVVYLVRKGLTLNESGIFPPVLRNDPGYRRDYTKPIIPNAAWETPILEDTVFNIDFDKITSGNTGKNNNLNNSSWLDDLLPKRSNGSNTPNNDWLPGDPLPSTPGIPTHIEKSNDKSDDTLNHAPKGTETDDTHLSTKTNENDTSESGKISETKPNQNIVDNSLVNLNKPTED